MTRNSSTRSEIQAARIVAAQTNCFCTRLDPGGGATQLPDFQLEDARGKRIGVLEVTSVVVGELLAFRSANVNYELADDQLRSAWFIVLRGTRANHRELQKNLAPLLVEAERHNFVPSLPYELIPNFNFSVGDEPQTSLYDLGVWMLTALPGARAKAGSISVKPPAQGGAIGPTQVTEAVQIALEKPDNLAKLSTAGQEERRELFVWLDDGNGGMALVAPRLFPGQVSVYPKDGPALPPQLTRVWAATGPDDRDVLARGLWVADGGVWQVINPPPVRLYS